MENVALTALLTVEQVAQRLQMTDRHVRTLIGKGLIQSFKIGRSRRISEQHLADFLAAHEVASSSTHVPGQLELNFEIAADEVPASTTHQSPVGTQLAA